jgi:hypothetical protein
VQGDDLSIFGERIVSVGLVPKLITMGWLRGRGGALAIIWLYLVTGLIPWKYGGEQLIRPRTFVGKLTHIFRVYECGLSLPVRELNYGQLERHSMKTLQTVETNNLVFIIKLDFSRKPLYKILH